MAIIQRYPRMDRRDFIPLPGEDAAWAEGLLSDGRPIRIECWYSSGFTYLTHYVSVIGIENVTALDLKRLLVAEGVVAFDDGTYRSSGFQGINLSADKIVDPSGNEMWRMTVIVGDENGTYVRDGVPLQRYIFPEKQTPEGQDVKTVDFFLAICTGTPTGDTGYVAYLVNNTLRRISAKARRWKEERIVEPKSRLLVRVYEGWEFDFPNREVIQITDNGRTDQPHFVMEKYLILDQKTDPIPVLNVAGWVVFP